MMAILERLAESAERLAQAAERLAQAAVRPAGPQGSEQELEGEGEVLGVMVIERASFGFHAFPISWSCSKKSVSGLTWTRFGICASSASGRRIVPRARLSPSGCATAHTG
jgi:hypothetical protein